MKKTRVLAVLMGAALSMAAALPAYAGEWVFDGPEDWKKWYREDDGSYTVNDWKQIGGKWYHFDVNGYLDVGGWRRFEVKNENGSSWEWFYLDDSGVWIENLTTDTGHMTPEGFRFDHDDSSKEDKEYWNAKVQEYGYDKIEVSEVVRGDDGYKYAVLHFPYIDNAGDFAKMTGKTFVDCKQVALSRVEQLFPYYTCWTSTKEDEFELRVLYWGKESNGEWVQDGPAILQRHFILENGTKAEGLQEIDGKHYFFDSHGNPESGWRCNNNEWSLYDEFGGRIDNFTTDTGRVDQDGLFHVDHSWEDKAYWNSKILEYGYQQNMKVSQTSDTEEDGIKYEYKRYEFPYVGGAEDEFKCTGVTRRDCMQVAIARFRLLCSDYSQVFFSYNKDGVYVDVR